MKITALEHFDVKKNEKLNMIKAEKRLKYKRHDL